jgi:hypothetical protein
MATEIMEKFNTIPNQETIIKTAKALRDNGFSVHIVVSGSEAKKKVFELIPPNAEVMDMTSRTLETTGIAKEINHSGKYTSVRNKLNAMDQKTESAEMRHLGAVPAWAIGSVHAVTEEGHVFVASATGSQLSAYAYGAGNVMWVVGAQKIVTDDIAALERINTYVFPLEDQRAMVAYGVHSGVNKLFIVNKEVAPHRITIILVREKLGF